MVAGVTLTLVDVNLTVLTHISWRTHTGRVSPSTFTVSSILAPELQTGVLIDLTVLTCELRGADALVSVDQISACGVILTRSRQAFIILLLTVQTMITWNTQTAVTSADAAADAVSAWVEGTEVHQLGTGGSSETCRTSAAEAQTSTLWGAAGVIMAGP